MSLHATIDGLKMIAIDGYIKYVKKCEEHISITQNVTSDIVNLIKSLPQNCVDKFLLQCSYQQQQQERIRMGFYNIQRSSSEGINETLVSWAIHVVDECSTGSDFMHSRDVFLTPVSETNNCDDYSYDDGIGNVIDKKSWIRNGFEDYYDDYMEGSSSNQYYGGNSDYYDEEWI
jgi:hypothetical protein